MTRDDKSVARWTLPLIALAAVAAYYPGLDNFFSDIDDTLYLHDAATFSYSAAHFRPLHGLYGGLLRALFGLEPFGYHAVGLVLHTINATLVAVLARRLAGSPGAGLVAGLAFAVFYTPHQAVLWFTAHVYLLSLLFILLCCLAFSSHLRNGGARSYVAALLAMAGAMACKEDCVLLGPALLTLDLLHGGVRKWSKQRVLRYVPFAVMAIAYVLLAFQPDAWRDRPGLGAFEIGPAMVPKILRSLGVLFWPLAVDERVPAAWTLGAGIAFVLGAITAAAGLRRGRGLILFGLVFATASFAAVAPGPFGVYSRRFAYAAACGGSLIVAGIAVGLWYDAAVSRPRLRRLIVASVAGLISAQVVGLHLIEAKRYETRGQRLVNMIASTRSLVLDELRRPGAKGPALVIAPPTFRPEGYLYAIRVFTDWPQDAIGFERIPYGPHFHALLDRGGRFAVTEQPVFACTDEGELFRLNEPGDAPSAAWQRMAAHSAKWGTGSALPVFRIRMP